MECAFGEIDLRWGIFWKRLTGSLEHSALIIEGAMHLHNFLVEYRDAHTSSDESTDEVEERTLFEEDLCDSGAEPIVVGNDKGRPGGRPTCIEKYYKVKGLKLRDGLRLSLCNHDMHRPRKEEWATDLNTHTVRN